MLSTGTAGRRLRAGLAAIAAVVAAWTLTAPAAQAGRCSNASNVGAATVLDFRFCGDSEGWSGGFADLPSSGLADPAFGLSFGRAPLPPSSGLLGEGLRIAGTNASDDLLMFLKRQVTGLRPQARYAARFQVRFATNTGRACSGDLSESVTAKAGAGPVEPQAVRDAAGILRLNLDVGRQARPGADAVVLGSAGADGIGCSGRWYAVRTLASRDGAQVARSDRDGNLWLFLGFDSGFAGRTDIHLERVRVELAPLER